MRRKVYSSNKAVVELRQNEIIIVLTGKNKAILKHPLETGGMTIMKGGIHSGMRNGMISVILLTSDGKLYEWRISKEDPQKTPTGNEKSDAEETSSDEEFYSSADESEDLIEQRRKMTNKDNIPWCITNEEACLKLDSGLPCIFRFADGQLVETNGSGNGSIPTMSKSKTKRMDEEIKNYQNNYLRPSEGYLKIWFPRVKLSPSKGNSDCGFRLIASDVEDFVQIHHDYYDFAIKFINRPGYYKEMLSKYDISDAGSLVVVQGKLFGEAEGFLQGNWWRNSPSYIVTCSTGANGTVYEITFIMEEGMVRKYRLLDDTRAVVPETIRVVPINNMNYIVYQDKSGNYYSVPSQFAHYSVSAKEWRRPLYDISSLHTGEDWFALHDKHSFVDFVVEKYERRSLRSRVKIMRFHKPLHLVRLLEHRDNRRAIETYAMVIDAEDPRDFIKTKNLALVNIRALAPDYLDHPENEGLLSVKTMRTKSRTASGFFYRTGNDVMYCPYPFDDFSPPVLVTTLQTGEYLFLSTHPTIHNGTRIWVLDSEGRIDVSRPPPPVYPINLELDEEEDPESIIISLSPEKDPYNVLTQVMEFFCMGYSESYSVSWIIENLGDVVSEGDGVGREYNLLVGRKIQEMYLITGRFAHFSQSLSRMSDPELHVLGKVLRVCSFCNSLPVLPLAFYAGIKYHKWDENTKKMITDADLYYFAGLADPERMEDLEEMRIDPTKANDAGFCSYREALETFCELDRDDQYEREINLIVKGYKGNVCDTIEERNLGSIRALMTGRDLIDRSKWIIKHSIRKNVKRPSPEKLERFISKLKALDEDKLRRLLVNWSGSRWLSNDTYTIRVEKSKGVKFATCSQTLVISSRFFRKQNELIDFLIDPEHGFNTD